jgi:HPt (histidine-containing phosphotransfer) domain-containing protein
MIDVLQQLSGCKGEPEQAQAETQEVPPTVSGVSLPVLDIEAGLRTWRDEAAYKKYLRRFASTDGQCGRQVAVLLEQGRSSEASAITHRLKGSSGALAMAQVEHVSRLLDERVLSGGAPENLPEQLQTALDIALDAIKDYAGSASEDISASRIDTAASGTVGPLLAEMLRALERDNPDEAESILASLAKEVPEEMLRGICERVEAFDFRAAEAQVKALAGKLEISV